MKKAKQRLLVDIFLFLLFLLVGISGLVRWFVLPEDGFRYRGGLGPGGTGGEIFIFPRYLWNDIHRWAAVAMALLLLIHLILNWRWIVVTLTRFLKGEL